MPTRVWFHISDYAASLYGTLIIIREFNQLFLAQMPAVYPVFYVISKWQGTFNEQYTYSVRLTSPSGANVFTTPEEQVKITGGPNGTEHVSVTQHIQTGLPEFGEYKVRLLINGSPVYGMPLHVFPIKR